MHRRLIIFIFVYLLKTKQPMLKVAAQQKSEAQKQAQVKKSMVKKAAPAKTVAAKNLVATKNT
jgi:hypothetical protein